MTREIRVLTAVAVELRAKDDGETLVGTPIVYDSWSDPICGLFRERIRPGAFDRYLKDNPDVIAAINHDPAKLLGRTSSGTLKMNRGEKGISVECSLPDTTYGRDLAESIRRGDIRGMSFQFSVVPGGDRWYLEDGEERRDILDARIYEVSAVTDPAYPATDVGLRSATAAFNEAVAARNRANVEARLSLLKRRLRLMEADIA